MKRKLIKYHRLLGLFLSINFLAICLSGIILVWKEEIENRNSAQISTQSDLEFSSSYALVAQKIKTQYPQKKILSIFKNDSGLINVRIGEKGQYKFKGAIRKLYYPDATEVLVSKDLSKGWLDWLLRLHRQLLLGGKGKYLVALIGILLVFILSSGALIIPLFRGLKDKSEIRFKISRCHQKIGAITFSWLILITFTGIFLALNSLLIGLFLKSNLEQQRVSLKKESFIVIERALEDVVSKSKQLLPEYEVDFISYPDNEFSLPDSYAILMEKERDQKIIFIRSNQSLDSRIIELPWYLKVLIISEPLHFGNYGGIGLKIFWTIFGIFAGVIPLTGISNYYYRKIKKKRTRKEKEINNVF